MVQYINTGKRCAECRNGEHDNYNDNVRLVVVKNPDGGRVRRLLMCEDHVTACLDDGYEVTIK